MHILFSDLSPFVASNIPPAYTNMAATHEITKSIKNELVLLKKIIEYTSIGNAINNKNKTPKKLATAILAFCRYSGTINLFSAFHNVLASLAHTASTRCSPPNHSHFESRFLNLFSKCAIFNNFSFHTFVRSHRIIGRLCDNIERCQRNNQYFLIRRLHVMQRIWCVKMWKSWAT